MRARMRIIMCLLGGVAVLLAGGCSSGLQRTSQFLRGLGPMDAMAEARYQKGMHYLAGNRFELAREQFAIAAISATRPDMQRQAIEGYQKANRMIIASE